MKIFYQTVVCCLLPLIVLHGKTNTHTTRINVDSITKHSVVFEYPPYLGQRSVDELNRLRGEADSWAAVGRIVALASIASTVQNVRDNLQPDVPQEIVKNTYDLFGATEPGESMDFVTPMHALAAVSEIQRQRTIAFAKLFRDDYLLEMNEQERRFWDRTIEFMERPDEAKKYGVGWGDPHYLTFDGTYYEMQRAGEFILFKALGGLIHVQVRTKPWNNIATAHTATSMYSFGDTISLYVQDAPTSGGRLYLNGESIALSKLPLQLRSQTVVRLTAPNEITVEFPTGEAALVRMFEEETEPFMDVLVSGFKNTKSGYTGLLGDADDQPDNDLTPRKNQATSTVDNVLKQTADFLRASTEVNHDFIHQTFATSWAVTADISLFRYPLGKTTSSFTDTKFPTTKFDLGQLTPDELEKLRKDCKKSAKDENSLRGCMYDLAVTGNKKFAQLSSRIFDARLTLEKIWEGHFFKEAVEKQKQKIKSLPGDVLRSIKNSPI